MTLRRFITPWLTNLYKLLRDGSSLNLAKKKFTKRFLVLKKRYRTLFVDNFLIYIHI
jgi:hypothetical protein